MAEKYTLPELPYDYAALEPHISAKIMELHHDKHHAAYVAGANTALEQLAEARESGNFGSDVGGQGTVVVVEIGQDVGHRDSSVGDARPGRAGLLHPMQPRGCLPDGSGWRVAALDL